MQFLNRIRVSLDILFYSTTDTYFHLPQVLLWLKQWDSCVFGAEIRSTSDDVLSALRRHSTTQYQRSFDSKFSNSKGYRWKNGSYRKSANSGNGNDELKGIQGLLDKKSRVTGPPEQKVTTVFCLLD